MGARCARGSTMPVEERADGRTALRGCYDVMRQGAHHSGASLAPEPASASVLAALCAPSLPAGAVAVTMRVGAGDCGRRAGKTLAQSAGQQCSRRVCCRLTSISGLAATGFQEIRPASGALSSQGDAFTGINRADTASEIRIGSASPVRLFRASLIRATQETASQACGLAFALTITPWMKFLADRHASPKCRLHC